MPSPPLRRTSCNRAARSSDCPFIGRNSPATQTPAPEHHRQYEPAAPGHLICRSRRHLNGGDNFRAWRGSRERRRSGARRDAAGDRSAALAARSGDGGVTLKMLVAEAEQGCCDRSLDSECGLACPLSVHESQAQQR